MQDPNSTRPTDPAGTSLPNLLAGCKSHLTTLVNTRLGVAEPAPADRLRAAALDALVYGQALADRLTAMRWVTVAEALAHGAPVAHVAAALGLETDEVAAGRRSWAKGQHQHADTPAAAPDEAHPLLDDREVGR